MNKKYLFLAPIFVGLAVSSYGCATVDVTADTKHRVTVDPIYVKVDIAIKIDRKFDRLFGPVTAPEDKKETTEDQTVETKKEVS